MHRAVRRGLATVALAAAVLTPALLAADLTTDRPDTAWGAEATGDDTAWGTPPPPAPPAPATPDTGAGGGTTITPDDTAWG